MPVLILAVLVGLWLVSQWTPLFNSEARRVKKLAEELERPYREDKYGGKTPEETYDLFISALKAGNVELASKYFEPYAQDNWLETLQEYKGNNSLDDFTKELENTRKIWKKSEKSDEETVSFTYKVLIEEDGTATFEGQEIEIPAGNYTNSTEFHKNMNGVWKIYGL